MPRWIDDHCHLGFDAGRFQPTPGDDADSSVEGVVAALVAEAREVGVERMITVGCDLASSREAIAAAEAHDGVWATVGLHPHEARHGLDGLEPLLDHPKVVAVGECGLDYHYDHSPRADQRAMFAAQIALAQAHDLPLVVHTREAWDDTFDILAAQGVPSRTVIHCFTGGPDEARRCLDLGAHLSFSGIVTFKAAADVQAAAALCPLDRLLVETDSPYLAPTPNRGKANRPAWVVRVGEAVAALHDVAVDEVADRSWRNAIEVYALPDA
ncbi:MAG TPA: TatD family hydrolase [Acidimicrobiales bacterium]|nr:TatD family hydrolase [Acidimicrobiales bacterium]